MSPGYSNKHSSGELIGELDEVKVHVFTKMLHQGI
jgi:hypothetical protein